MLLCKVKNVPSFLVFRNMNKVNMKSIMYVVLMKYKKSIGNILFSFFATFYSSFEFCINGLHSHVHPCAYQCRRGNSPHGGIRQCTRFVNTKSITSFLIQNHARTTNIYVYRGILLPKNNKKGSSFKNELYKT